MDHQFTLMNVTERDFSGVLRKLEESGSSVSRNDAGEAKRAVIEGSGIVATADWWPTRPSTPVVVSILNRPGFVSAEFIESRVRGALSDVRAGR